MARVPLQASDVAPSEEGGYTLASCEPYWIILAVFIDAPGCIFEWAGAGWSDLLADAMLFDRAEAEAEVLRLGDLPGRTVRSANFADYLRYDRRMAGYPRRRAWKARHGGSFQALADIYQELLSQIRDAPGDR
jgi:hypothetical protein